MDKGLNFRHLIKTFVPGLFTFFSLFLLFDLIVLKSAGIETELAMWKFITSNNVLIVSLLIPAALFTGIVINTICFVNLIPLIKKNQKKSVERDDINYYKFSESSFIGMRNHYKSKLFKNPDKIDDTTFSNFFDVKSFLLHEQDMTRLQYIKTGYWYYLEFQLNSIVTIFIALLSINFNVFYREIQGVELHEKFWILICSITLGLAMSLLLYKAIIKNLKKDRKIELSYIIGAYSKNSRKRLKN